MKRIILITGGQRSGKSSFAEKKAHELTTSPVYLATARIWDEEFRKRVERHQKNRGPEWTNIEEEKELSRHNVAGRVVVIDCVTLWCTNFFMEFDSNVASSLEAVKKEFDKFTQQDATFIFVTNEIGWAAAFGAHGNGITSVQTDRRCTLPLHSMTADGNRCSPVTVLRSKTAHLPATASPLKRWGTCSTPFTVSPLHRKTWHSSRERRMSGGSFSICRFPSCNRTVWSWYGGINSSYRTGMPSYGSL